MSAKKNYNVALRGGMVSVNGRVYLFENFVYGCPSFLPETHDLPDYVHTEVWALNRRLRELGINHDCPCWSIEVFWTTDSGTGSSYRTSYALTADDARNNVQRTMEGTGYTITGWGTVQQYNK